jgi:hypothetical protein
VSLNRGIYGIDPQATEREGVGIEIWQRAVLPLSV